MQLRFTFLVLIVAVVASVFAIWPVVADAPWEEEAVIIVQEQAAPAPKKSGCGLLFEQLTEARTEIAGRVINSQLYNRGCTR